VIHHATVVNFYLLLALLAAVLWRKDWRKNPIFLALLGDRLLVIAVTFLFLFHRKWVYLDPVQAYNAYFYSYWTLTAIQEVIQLLIIQQVYRNVMKPLEGLQNIGNIIFRWIFVVSGTLALMVALGPHHDNMLRMNLLGQVQQGTSTLTVCLLVFVCFAARPLGLNFRNRSFGIALGLGINSTACLVISAWFASSETRTLFSPVFAWGTVVTTAIAVVWLSYYLAPEPARRILMLPTTSPYFFWNSISEAMGDDPGNVVIGGLHPAMLSSAEVMALTSPSDAGAVLSPDIPAARLESLIASA